MAYSLPYILVLIVFAILAVIYAQRRNKEDSTWICALVCTGAVIVFYVFFAFRGYVYSDWVGYSESYKDVEWSDIFAITNKNKIGVIHEPGFTALMCLCSIFTREYAFLVIVITTIDTLLFIRFLRQWQVENIPFAFMLFFTFLGVGLMFNALRNQLAIFIFMNALIYIERKQPLPYFLICLLALCFHVSSIIFCPLYFFLGRKLNKWIFLGLVITFFVFYISQISILLTALKLLGIGGALGEKAEIYTEGYSSARALSPTGTLEKLGLTMLVFLYYDKLTSDKGGTIFINSLLLCFFFYYVFGEFYVLSSRLSMLFQYSYWVLWVKLMGVFSIQNNKRLYGSLLFLYCLYVTIQAYPTPIQEYDNLLFGAKSQEERMKIFNKTFEDLD